MQTVNHTPAAESYPLSFAQQRLWFLHQWAPETPLYNESFGFRLRGNLNVDAFRKSLTLIVRRHATLRTTFVPDGGTASQRIGEPTDNLLALVDLRNLPKQEREPAAVALGTQEARRPFDLTAGPLVRMNLFQLAEQDYLFVLVVHHAVWDAWSGGLFFQELSTAYAALAEGQVPELPVLRSQYVDFAVWQRERLEREILPQQLPYWRQQLNGQPPALLLPTDRPRPAVRATRGERLKFVAPAALMQSLKQVSRQEGSTLYMTLLAAFTVLMHRYTGQEDLIVGSPIAGRTAPEVEGLIGFFVNMLPIRSNVAHNPTFRQLVRDLRGTTLDAYAHQDVPFERLVEELNPERDLSHTPLVQVVLAYRNALREDWSLPGVAVSTVEIHNGTVKFDITLDVVEKPEGLVGRLEYNAELFNADTIQRMVSQFQTLLGEIVKNPDRTVQELPLLTADERHRLLNRWSDINAVPEPSRCLHELFAEQAARHPERVAVVLDGQSLTYGELNRKANQLAHYLQRQGVRPETLVGLWVERSMETIIGILAVLKAGGAYVPLDPGLPAERLNFLLEDSGAPIVLTQQKLLGGMPSHTAATICLDSDWPAIACEPVTDPQAAVTPSNCAYVIYTSGSTGQPKGVVVEHRNVVTLFNSTQRWFAFTEADVWQLFHSPGFDFSVWEIWGALIYGGRLVVVPYWVSRSPEAFYELLAAEGVTILTQTPSAFKQLIRAEERLGQKELRLRRIIFGGEALELQSLRPWFDRHGDECPVLVNMYGITETTIHSTYREIRLRDLTESAGSMIGCPVPAWTMYILDGQLQPVPEGVAGEIFVGGAGVARGYLNLPELTAKRFIQSPFIPGDRLYRSGDLARLLPSGDLEYLGRIDHQIKIRGFRVELGEIESILGQHLTVREVVVLAREDASGQKQLIAFLVPAPGQTIRVADLRAYLRDRLPEYMVPGPFTVLDALPLTPNGKVDRRALLGSQAVSPEPEESMEAPSSVTEEMLSPIWAAVLGHNRIGVSDNFFDLGGDSIRAIQVVALARERGLTFAVQDLFKAQTIRALAQLLTAERSASEGAEHTSPFSLLSDADRAHIPAHVEDAYPLARLQAGMLFHAEFSPESAVYHDILSYHMRAPFNIEALRASLQYVAARHAILRTSVDLTSYSEPLQLVHRQVEIPLTTADLQHLSEEEQEQTIAWWMKTEKTNRFTWGEPPLLRAQVHLRSQDTFQFSITFSHVLLDGWSFASMMTELLHNYLRLLDGEGNLYAPPLATAYRDFVTLERQTLASAEFKRFWDQKLNHASVMRLPRWVGRRSAGADSPNGYLTIPISPGVSDGLQKLAISLGLPIKSVLLAAHLKVLAFLGGQSDILTGLVLNGRPEGKDGERILGLFLNTLPLRIQLGGGTWRDLVHSVFAAEREILPYRRYPMEQIQSDWGGESLYEVSFGFNRFHVYRNVLGQGKLEILGARIHESTNFALSAQFSQDLFSSQVKLTLIHNAREIPVEQAEVIGGYYTRVLEAMAANPEAQYQHWTPFSAAELERLIHEWNRTDEEHPRNFCFHELFSAQAAKTPDLVAVVYGDEWLTYRELDERANQVANFLQKRGVGPEVLIGLWGERNADMIVGILGILKAGGAYMPLDPALPKERVGFMLRDAGVNLLLTQQPMTAMVPEDVQTIFLDQDWDEIGKEDRTAPATGLRMENRAYVIYTSGSTGTPKGVVVEHGHLLNHIHDYVKRLGPEPGNNFVLVQSLAVDASIQTIVLPLCTGGCLHVLTKETSLDADAMVQYFQKYPIHYLKLAPSHLISLHGAHSEKIMPKRWLILGGEATRWEWMRQLQHLAPGCNVISQYGPTETAVAMMTFPVKQWLDADWFTITPLGRSISNTQLYVLDENWNLCPIGVTGELFIGGANVARGYLNRPDLTAERYIPDPFSGRPGARLYKSGDLVRYMPNGMIEFVNRVDGQVKVRGFRVELGEIQSVLGSYPSVLETVLLVREDTPGDKQLTAYVVPNAGAEVTARELRDYLRSKLPEYMVPGAIVLLAALPRTGHGKVDRQALPAPTETQQVEEVAQAVPRSPVEEVLSGIWATVLGVDSVPPNVQFYDLGGNSLRATQIIARTRNAFGVDIPLRMLFEAPTVQELAARITAVMAGDGSQLLAPPLSSTRRDGQAPLSFAQQRLWFLDQLSQGLSVYNVPRMFRLSGELDVSALQRSLQAIVDRHEILRTRYPAVNGVPTQEVMPQAVLNVPVIDLTDVLPPDREHAALDLAQAEIRRPFALADDLLIRCTLIRLANADHMLVLSMHHIVTDWWSHEVFVRELTTLYKAFQSGSQPALPPLAIQYGDYATWQRIWLQGEVLERQLAYWKQQLGGPLPVIQLPTDHPRPPIQTFNGAIFSGVLEADTRRALGALSQQEGATLFMTLLTGFKALLYRYTAQEDVIVGSPIAGRNQTGLEDLIGFFVNTLVLRTDLSGRPTFRSLLRRVSEVTLGAYTHQDLPFDKLVEALSPDRDMSHSPLFHVMFGNRPNLDTAINLPGMTVSPIWVDHQTAKVDLTVFTADTDDGLMISFEYNTDLFDQATIQRMFSHYCKLLREIVAQPDLPITELPLLSVQERDQLLNEWNRTDDETARPGCIHHLVEEWAARTPESVAVTLGEERLTYRELNAKANQLANYLRRLGAGPEVLVGLCMERSMDMIVAMLGILKSGAAYVPLDPANPAERLALMLDDAQVPIMLVQERLLSRLQPCDCHPVCIDRDWPEVAQLSPEAPDTGVTPHHLAYMIYTSGSTGRPNGVMVEHGGVCNLLTAAAREFGVTERSHVSEFASISFDASVWQTFIPLTHGATLCVISAAEQMDVAALAARLRAEKVSFADLPVVVLDRLVPQAVPDLKQIVTGGERCHRELAARWSADRNFYNIYGPTEATIATCWFRVPSQLSNSTSVPIGRPTANVRVYVLDSELHPVPVGVPGELYIGGVGVARGYLKRPALTAAKFVPDPFSGVTGARLYRTGDMVRYLRDGNIEFLERVDGQVKIRGFRVELTEIEAVLDEHPDLLESAVIAVGEHPNKQLVAFVAPVGESQPSKNELQRFARRKLPEYMVPSQFLWLDRLPRTPSRKLDRQLLQGSLTEAVAEPRVAPGNPVEEMIAGFWSELFGLPVERVSVVDNFFSLGGHSLMATQLLSRIRSTLQVDVPLLKLYEAPTIEGLAEAILDAKMRSVDATTVATLLSRLASLTDEEADELLSRYQQPSSQSDVK